MLKTKFLPYFQGGLFLVKGFKIEIGYTVRHHMNILLRYGKMARDGFFRIGRDSGDEVGPFGGKVKSRTLCHLICHTKFPGKVLEEKIMYSDNVQAVLTGWGHVLIMGGVNLITGHHLRQLMQGAPDLGDGVIADKTYVVT